MGIFNVTQAHWYAPLSCILYPLNSNSSIHYIYFADLSNDIEEVGRKLQQDEKERAKYVKEVDSFCSDATALLKQLEEIENKLN